MNDKVYREIKKGVFESIISKTEEHFREHKKKASPQIHFRSISPNCIRIDLFLNQPVNSSADIPSTMKGGTKSTKCIWINSITFQIFCGKKNKTNLMQKIFLVACQNVIIFLLKHCEHILSSLAWKGQITLPTLKKKVSWEKKLKLVPCLCSMDKTILYPWKCFRKGVPFCEKQIPWINIFLVLLDQLFE